MGKQAEFQYTIRGVSPEVDAILRRKAAQTGKSLNQFIVDELTTFTIGHPQRANFNDVVGRWQPDPAFDEVLAAQREVDPDLWK